MADGDATPPERTPLVVPVEISAPEALVRRIYTLPDPDVGAFIDPQRRPAFYTSRIHSRALRMERCYAKKYGMDFLDIDYIVPGNDYDITDLSFTLVNSTRRAATINVRFNRSAGAIDPISLFYHLKLTRGGWRIDDVAYEKETLAKSLSGKC
ncbi:MAG: hypothetical protein IT566_11410 [Rhodospirillaceae bacterium]|nr:hypothetical protein [Rhodospirillaceae bacterium]